MLGVLAFSHVVCLNRLKGYWQAGQSMEPGCGGVDSAAGNGVAGGDAGEAAVGVRAAGGGVEERERGAGGSVESVDWPVSLMKRR